MEKKLATPEQRELFQKLIASHKQIEAKGKTMPYASHNGNMFVTFSSQAKLGLRMNAENRAAFIEKYKTELLQSHGTTMKEYITVPDDLLKRTEELKTWLDKSWEYVQSLKPKATTRKKK